MSSNLIDFTTEIFAPQSTAPEYVNGLIPNPRAANTNGGSATTSTASTTTTAASHGGGHKDPFDMSKDHSVITSDKYEQPLTTPSSSVKQKWLFNLHLYT